MPVHVAIGFDKIHLTPQNTIQSIRLTFKTSFALIHKSAQSGTLSMRDHLATVFCKIHLAAQNTILSMQLTLGTFSA